MIDWRHMLLFYSFFLFAIENEVWNVELPIIRTSCDYDVYIYASWQWNHIAKQYHTIVDNNIRVEKELSCRKTSIAHRFIKIENINKNNWKMLSARSNRPNLAPILSVLYLSLLNKSRSKFSSFVPSVGGSSPLLKSENSFYFYKTTVSSFQMTIWISTCSWTTYQQFHMDRCVDKAAFKRQQPSTQ
jgi:hypothetical protein